MLAMLRDPIPFPRLALISAGVATVVAIYCLAYSALAGRPETVPQSFGWAIVNILPWILALEGAKRARTISGAGAAFVAGMAASLILGMLLFGATDLPFQAWRRVPSLAIVATLAIWLRWGNQRRAATPEELPLLPRQIDWVRAAGNYVELQANGRAVVHRASLSAVEQQLDGHGFIRIHRSLIVRRDRIARVRPEDVVLLDGTHLKIGKRYRADLAA